MDRIGTSTDGTGTDVDKIGTSTDWIETGVGRTGTSTESDGTETGTFTNVDVDKGGFFLRFKSADKDF